MFIGFALFESAIAFVVVGVDVEHDVRRRRGRWTKRPRRAITRLKLGACRPRVVSVYSDHIGRPLSSTRARTFWQSTFKLEIIQREV